MARRFHAAAIGVKRSKGSKVYHRPRPEKPGMRRVGIGVIIRPPDNGRLMACLFGGMLERGQQGHRRGGRSRSVGDDSKAGRSDVDGVCRILHRQAAQMSIKRCVEWGASQ